MLGCKKLYVSSVDIINKHEHVFRLSIVVMCGYSEYRVVLKFLLWE